MRRATAHMKPSGVLPADEQPIDSLSSTVRLAADDTDGGHSGLDVQEYVAPVRLRPLTYLAVYAEAYHQAQQTRLRVLNACRMAVRDSDVGKMREGDFSDKSIKEMGAIPVDLRALAAMVIDVEKWAAKGLLKELDNESLWPYLNSIRGIGPVLAGKLIAWLPAISGFANVAKLWQYCGHGDPLRSKRKAGEKTTYNPRLKTVIYLIATGQMKSNGPYRRFYDAERTKWESRPWCGKCNPAGSKKVRENCTDGHANGHALRIVGKEFLADLWEHVHAGGLRHLGAQKDDAADSHGGQIALAAQTSPAPNSNGGHVTGVAPRRAAPKKKRVGGGHAELVAQDSLAPASRKKSAA